MKSKIKIKIRNCDIEVETKRHLSPEIIRKIFRLLPMESYAYQKEEDLFIKLDLGLGARQKIPDLDKGDMFYNIEQSNLGITNNSRKANTKEIKIGRVTKGMEHIKKFDGIIIVKILVV